MPCLERQLQTRDGLRLATYSWTSAEDIPPRAVIVLTHGHGEYASKYGHVAQAFNAGGYAVHANNLRGHGRSGGPRGHAPRYEALLSDLRLVHDEAGRQFPGRPICLYGHSLGGQITLNYALERRPAVLGVVVSAPWLKLVYRPPAWKVGLAQLLANVLPGFTQETGLDTAIPMTHDAALLAAYPDQHLTHAKMSARLGMDALRQGEALLARAGEFSLPLLVLHGGADGVFKPETSQDFVARAASADKTFKVYPGLYHEIHNEVEREHVFRDVLAWLDQRAH